MLTGQTMELQVEETPLALQRLWNLTRARLAGTSTALDEELALGETLPAAQVKILHISLLFFLLSFVLFNIHIRGWEVRSCGVPQDVYCALK